MSDQTNSRKVEHIRAIENDADTDRDGRYFDAIRLTHRALPEIALADVNPATEFLGKALSFPLLISSMTDSPMQAIAQLSTRSRVQCTPHHLAGRNIHKSQIVRPLA